jgi:hypothetical protein
VSRKTSLKRDEIVIFVTADRHLVVLPLVRSLLILLPQYPLKLLRLLQNATGWQG